MVSSSKRSQSSSLPVAQTPQPDLATQSTIATMQKQIASLQKQLDELKTTVQPLLPLAEAMEKHSLDLQEAKVSLDKFTQLSSIAPIIMQVAPLILKIISMAATYALAQSKPITNAPLNTPFPLDDGSHSLNNTK